MPFPNDRIPRVDLGGGALLDEGGPEPLAIVLMRFALSVLVLLAASVVVSGCQSRIGDACVSDFECQSNETCDTSVNRGYCTIYDCDVEGCPDEAVCVDFEVVTACMLSCTKDSQCRSRGNFVCRRDIGGTGFCYAPEGMPTVPTFTPSELPEWPDNLPVPPEGSAVGEGSALGAGSGEAALP